MRIDKPLDPTVYLSDSQNNTRVDEIIETIEKLCTANSSGAVNVAINGAWGTGKSTLLKALESKYKDKDSPTLFFEAWRYAHEPDIFLALLEQLHSILPTPYEKGKLRKIIKSMGAVFLLGADHYLKAALGISVDDITKKLELIDKHINKIVTQTTRQRQALHDMLSQLGSEDKPFVLLIDDLDRLMPEQAFKLLERLRFFFEGDHTIIIMAVNDEVINRYVHNRHDIDIHLNEPFLDKIFHYNFELNYSTLNPIHLRDLDSDIQRIIVSIGLGTLHLSHRKWINITNRIEREKSKLEDPTDAQLRQIVINTVLKELFPSFKHLYRKEQDTLFSSDCNALSKHICNQNCHYGQKLFLELCEKRKNTTSTEEL
jgi:hypothetical protein